jgi:tripartite-type tricarboxylate transporter receptor subunit TctC
VGFGPGGGYDTWARAVGNHMGKHLPGEPDIIVENMPGAGSLIAANFLANVAPKDGTAIGILGRDVFLEPVLGNEQAQFELGDFSFIGSASTETSVCFAHETAPVQTTDALMKDPIIIGAMAPGNGTYKYPKALNAILGFNFDIIAGYESSTAINLAMEQGEVGAICESYDSLATRHPDWIENGTVKVLVMGGVSPDPRIDAPFAIDLAADDEKRRQIRFLYAGQYFGRPFVAPAIPDEQADMLRSAFLALSSDAEFQAELDTLGYEFVPVPGVDLATFADELSETPDSLIEYINSITQ